MKANVSLLVILFFGLARLHGASPDAVRLAKEYLQASAPEQRQSIRKRLSAFDDQWRSILPKLKPAPFKYPYKGYLPNDHFRLPHLKAKRPDDRLYHFVPTSYTNTVPSGLVVFLHGGARMSPRTNPAMYLRFGKGEAAGDMFQALGLIAVGPSAPWNPKDDWRWCMPGVEDYIADVIEETSSRYNIDAHRVFLMGHSMGGFGAYHLGQTMPDRFAGIFPVAGAWLAAYWPGLRGTDFCMVHGAKDSEHGVRSRYTDVLFPRLAHQQMTELKIPHTYLEHPNGHAFEFARPLIRKYLEEKKEIRRDPIFPRVSLQTPVGYSNTRLHGIPHRRWITIDRADLRPIPLRGLKSPFRPGLEHTEPLKRWKQWRLHQTTFYPKGVAIAAEYLGENRFQVTTKNVRQFSLWLHPDMVDITKLAKVIVNGRMRGIEIPKESLVTALDSYLRRRDWGLIYPIRITIRAEESAVR